MIKQATRCLFSGRRRRRCVCIIILSLTVVCHLMYCFFASSALYPRNIGRGGRNKGEKTTPVNRSRPQLVSYPSEHRFVERNCQHRAFMSVPGWGAPVNICIFDPKSAMYASSSIWNKLAWEGHLVQGMLDLFLVDSRMFHKSGLIDVVDSAINSWFPGNTPELKKTEALSLVDLGCNIGVFTLSAAIRGYSVLAVDAAEASLRLLSASLYENNRTAIVTLVNNVISDTRGPAMLQTDSLNKGVSLVQLQHDPNTKSSVTENNVSAICLDDLVPYVPTNRVFLKMDIESFEARALRCADDFFRILDVSYALVEWAFPHNGSEAAYVINFLTSKGLKPYGDSGEDTPLQLDTYRSWPDNVFWVRGDY